MTKIEPELECLWKGSGAPHNLPHTKAHLEERVHRHDPTRRHHVPEGVEASPLSRAGLEIGGHEDGGGEGEGEGGEAEEEEELVEAAELVEGDGGVEVGRCHDGLPRRPCFTVAEEERGPHGGGGGDGQRGRW